MRPLLLLALLLLLPTTMAATPADPFSAGRLVDSVNDVRTPDLRWGPCVDAHAERHARQLAAAGAFRHSSMTTLGESCDRRGGWATGQVLGRGYTNPDELVDGWLASPPHRDVVTRPGYQRIGVGAAQARDGRWVVVVNVIRHR